MMEALLSSETSLLTTATQYNIPEDGNLNGNFGHIIEYSL
jgi:hypothetical protein